MRIGIHLPQFGKAIAPDGVERAAREAEQQGFDDVWVSDHLVNPREQAYPAPYILDPLITLALAGADCSVSWTMVEEASTTTTLMPTTTTVPSSAVSPATAALSAAPTFTG